MAASLWLRPCVFVALGGVLGASHERCAASGRCEGEAEDRSDLIQLMPLKRADHVGDRSFETSKGAERARLWQQCSAWAKDMRHFNNVIASAERRFVYADNVKAGSSTIRRLLKKVLNISWDRTDLPFHASLGVQNRTSSNGLAAADVDSLFKFSVVRDPVSKFESGVRQTWNQDRNLSRLTADEILDMQLQRISDGRPSDWVNEHLMPSSWRLSGYVGEGPIQLDFIGAIETMTQDWSIIVDSIGAGLPPPTVEKLLALGPPQNPRPEVAASKLSPQGIRKMCSSRLYGKDWECLGYELPDVCK